MEKNNKRIVHFSMVVYNPICLYWTGIEWASEDIIVL